MPTPIGGFLPQYRSPRAEGRRDPDGLEVHPTAPLAARGRAPRSRVTSAPGRVYEGGAWREEGGVSRLWLINDGQWELLEGLLPFQRPVRAVP